MSARARGVKGWHVLAAMLAFFGAVIAVNVAFVVVALRSFPGEDAPRSYMQGLHYNDTLAERRAQQALGWHARAALRAGNQGTELVVSLRGRDGAPLDGLVVSGDLGRRTSTASDRSLVFVPRGDGAYAADLGGLAPGQWRLRAHAARASGDALDFESDLAWR